MRQIENLRIKTETGQEKTLGHGKIFFKKIKPGQFPLFLGIGPNQTILPHLVPKASKFFVLETPQILNKLDPFTQNIILLPPNKLNNDLINLAEIWLYHPSLEYFPSFWQPILGQIYKPSTSLVQKKIWLLAHKNNLLTQEIDLAAQKLGFHLQLKTITSPQNLKQDLSIERPCLVISLNGRGLDKLGVVQAIFQAANIPLALWIVDNPWYILTKFKGNFISQLPIFITDNFFTPFLKQAGFSKVFYLPLATEPCFFQQTKKQKKWKSEIAFIGRVHFPNKNKYFAGQTLETKILFQGKKQIDSGKRSDCAWITKYIPLTPAKTRNIGAHLEELNLYYRIQILQFISKHFQLQIIGDMTWEKFFSNISISGPVDYYSQLKNIYTTAHYILNLTSFHLPNSLNQRHFDVWISNGFLLTDFSTGLNIFPNDIIKLISFQNKKEILNKISTLEKEKYLKQDIQTHMKKIILQKHTYTHRLEYILDILNIK